MPLKGIITSITDKIKESYCYSSPGTLNADPITLYSIENQYKNNKLVECKSKSPAPPPFMHQAAGADFQPLGHNSIVVDCNDCGSSMPSRVFYENGLKTHTFALIMCFLGFWCCAPLPYYLNNCRTANHYCGNCDHYLGSYPSETTISE